MIKKILLIASLSIQIIAQTTMCFKSDWSDPSTVETTTMDGGKCAGTNSIEQMKDAGWVVDDIKITSGKHAMNFMYILKKGNMIAFNNENLEDKLNKLQEKREKAKKEAEVQASALNGKKIYQHHCLSCHGKNGEIEAYNTSKRINTMSVEEIKIAFRDYSNDDKDNGMALIMKPYAGLVFGNDLEAVANYIQTLK